MSRDAHDVPAVSATGAGDIADLLGIAGTYPRPGWVVIDAIRDTSFTGEVVCATTPTVTLHADRGRIYVAERASDPPLGVRLVAAGALTPAELEQGVIRLAGAEHLGRLFERAPSIDRDAVLTANDLMTDDCLGWLAAQRVHGADVTPYRHHPSGMYRWEQGQEAAVDVAPPPPTLAGPPSAMPAPVGAPMPAPAGAPMPPPPAALFAPVVAPAEAGPAGPFAAPSPPPPEASPPGWSAPPPDALHATAAPTPPVPSAVEQDDVIRWDEPAFLDQPFAGDIGLGLIKPLPLPRSGPVDPAHTSLDPPEEPLSGARFDWFDRLDTPAVPERGADPLAHPTKRPPVPAEPVDRFEVIWPSGEIDEQFGGQPTDALPHPDIDRAGPTARLFRDGGHGPLRSTTALQSAHGDDAVDDAVADALGAGVDDIEVWLASESERDAATDDVVLAVRRAVASIETGALGTRERRTGPRGMSLGTLDAQLDARTDAAADTALVPPGRVAVRAEHSGEIPLTATGRMSRPSPSAGSVFDEVPPALPATSSRTDAVDHDDAPAERVSALRRLIGGLRRR